MKVSELFESFKSFLNEAKQVGRIFHLLNSEKMAYVLKSDSLTNQNFRGISTTRSKHLKNYHGEGTDPFFRLVLDGDKLSEKYRIKPHAYDENKTGVKFEEFEELIKTQKVKDISKYIIEIQIDKKRMEKFKSYFDMNDEWDKNEMLKLDDTLKNLHKLGKVVYV